MKTKTLPVLLAAFLAMSQGAHASSIAWTNTSGGNWSVPANWNPNQTPGSGDDVLITNNGTYTVTLDGSPAVNSLVLGGSSGQQSLATAGYNLTLNNASVVNANGIFVLSGGNLASSLLAVNGTLNWTGGSIGGGALTLATNGVLVLAGQNGNDYYLFGALTNAGTVRLVSGNLHLQGCSGGSGLLVNLPGGLVDFQADVNINSSGCGAELLNNQGTVRKSGGAGTSTISAAFNNSGLVDAQSGILNFTSSFVDTGGVLSVRISSATNWGQISFANALTLGGPFNVSVSSSYVPVEGSIFQVLHYPSVTGGFTVYNGLYLDGDLRFVPVLGGKVFYLQVSTYSPGPTPTMFINCVGGNLLVSWPTAFSNYQVMSTTNLAKPAWTPVSLTGTNQVLITPNQPEQYFRLMQ